MTRRVGVNAASGETYVGCASCGSNQGSVIVNFYGLPGGSDDLCVACWDWFRPIAEAHNRRLMEETGATSIWELL